MKSVSVTHNGLLCMQRHSRGIMATLEICNIVGRTKAAQHIYSSEMTNINYG